MKVKLLPKQYDFLHSDEPMLLFAGGIGTGKTFVLAHTILKNIIKYPEADILLCANTYSQLMNTTVPALVAVLDEAGIKYKSTTAGMRKRIEVGPVTVYLYSLDNPSVIRGLSTIGMVAIDEFCSTTKDAFNIVIGRLRNKKGSLTARFVGSPEGHNWVYDLVSEGKIKVINATTYDNPHLPDEYVKSLEELYVKGSALYKQEVLGEFVNIKSEAVYYAFSRTKHVKPVEYIPEYPIYVGVDFNIDNMSATFVQYIDGKYRVIKELKLTDENSNTFDLAIEIKRHFQNAQKYIVPDSTGNARKTSTKNGKTDIQILRDAGLNVLNTRNPYIRDRWNAVNKQLMLDNVEIDSSCTNLIKEMETLSVNQTEGKVAHLSVTLGYVIWHRDPIQKPQLKNVTIPNPFIR